MKTVLALSALILSASMSLTACSGDEGSNDVATDPNGNGGGDGNNSPMPTEPPVPPGQVRTVNLVTVMDTGTPELCMGPIAESFPPQCSGPEITNWNWAVHGQDMYDQEGDIRWGTYVVTGTWNGDTFEVTETIPGALYDPMVDEPTKTPAPSTQYSDAELEAIAEDLMDGLPGVQGAYGGEGSNGQVLVDVIYDDGSLQAWADQEYGGSVVLISSALVDA